MKTQRTNQIIGLAGHHANDVANKIKAFRKLVNSEKPSRHSLIESIREMEESYNMLQRAWIEMAFEVNRTMPTLPKTGPFG